MKYKFWLKIMLAVCLMMTMASSAKAAALNSQKYVQSTTPTFFFHGWGSGAHAERHMAQAAIDAGVTKTAIVANIAQNGTVELEGKIPHGAINPIIEVNLIDNENTNYTTDGHYAAAAIQKVCQTYHFKKYQVEAHSMGNMAFLYCLLQNTNNSKLPKLQKEVAMAGTFDGVIGWNQPANLQYNERTGEATPATKSYQKLKKLRHTYPTTARVLNIYGDLGDGTDSQVDNKSSKALKYLVAGRAKSYQEQRITGANAKHELLHRNPQVDAILIKFLWGK